MNRRDYRAIARRLPSDFLAACVRNPSHRMRPVHVLILRAVLRERGAL